jgi:hypothetical protein
MLILLLFIIIYINTIIPIYYLKTSELVWPRLLVPYLVPLKRNDLANYLLIVLLRLLCWSSII